MNLAEAFEQFRQFQKWQEKMAEYRQTLSTEKLKELWDAFDGDVGLGEPGYFWPEDSPHIEDVHFLLNERGEGAYCAV